MVFSAQNSDDGTVIATLAAALRRDISFGALRPDQRLKIDELRSRYGGSNHSMRETLRLLSAEGLVEVIAQRGFRVTSATEGDRIDIIFVRKAIDMAAVRRAIKYGDITWEGRVVGAHHQLRRAEDAVASTLDDLIALEWDDAYRNFFVTIMEACLSPRLLEMHIKYFDQSRRFRLASLREGNLDFAVRAERHKALVDAILARDADRAETLVAEEIEAELQN